MKTTWTAALILAACLITAPAARADIADSEDTAVPMRELDPFRPLIQPPVEVPPPVQHEAKQVAQPEPPRPIPPVQFTVTALAVDGSNHVAVIEFEGQTYIAQVGTKIPETGTPAMEVKSVTDEKVVVTDTRLARLVTRQLVER